MSKQHKPTAPFLFTTFLLAPLVAAAVEPQAGRIEITADYRYAAHETENLAEAKNLVCREAWRLAVVNSPLYREQTASVIDSPLLRDLAYTLAGHVQDQQIVEQTEQGRVLLCRVRGFLPTEESTGAIRTQLAGGPPSAGSLDQNRALRILSVREENGGTIAVQYQALKRLDWLGTHYQGGLRESADIMVDFYDGQGALVKTERYPARKTPTGEDILNPGAIAILKVARPTSAKTSRVWLVK
ncbi:MAG: hypothetical protein Q8L77_16165 [Nitrospirota bacterium]|nr:hypothetical protein [Nitrospirota bacterium]